MKKLSLLVLASIFSIVALAQTDSMVIQAFDKSYNLQEVKVAKNQELKPNFFGLYLAKDASYGEYTIPTSEFKRLLSQRPALYTDYANGRLSAQIGASAVVLSGFSYAMHTLRDDFTALSESDQNTIGITHGFIAAAGLYYYISGMVRKRKALDAYSKGVAFKPTQNGIGMNYTF